MLIITQQQLRYWCAIAISTVLITLTACTSHADPQLTTSPQDDKNMNWQTYCIGRVLIDLPTSGTLSWTNKVDTATIKRLPVMTEIQFWDTVEKQRIAYVAQKHDTMVSRLAYYKKLSPHAALMYSYPDDNFVAGGNLMQFVYLDSTHAYSFEKTDIRFVPYGQTPIEADITKSMPRFTPILDQLVPLPPKTIPSVEGLCLDGALLKNNIKEAMIGLNIEFLPRHDLGISYRENMADNSRGSSTFEELEQDIKASHNYLGNIFNTAPDGLKKLEVLRKQTRILAGLEGQETITRTTLNSGVVYYDFTWGIRGGGGLLEPCVDIHFTSPTINKTREGTIVKLLPEKNLFIVWERALSSLKIRQGALPANQTLKAIN